eukprot:2211546-Pyramimonas_sp.AAC.1
MLKLLNTWNNGEASRRPWFLLDILHAPLTDQSFARWARGQILKTNSVMARRYETRFSAWPYKMYPLSHDRSTIQEKLAVAREVLHAPEHMLDSYTK